MSLYDYVYLNEPKITNLYAGTVERAEDQITLTSENKISGKGTAKLSLATLLRWLGLNPEISAELAGEHAKSQEVVQKLLPVQKLQIVQATLEKENRVLTVKGDDPKELERLADRTSFATMQANFKLQGVKANDHSAWMKMLKDGPKPFVMFGELNKYKIRIVVASNSFVSPTIFPRFVVLSQAPNGIPLEVFGVVIASDEAAKTIEVDPIAMYYKGRAAF